VGGLISYFTFVKNKNTMETPKQDPNKDVLKPLIEAIISDAVITIKRLALINSVSPGSDDPVRQFVIDLLNKKTPSKNEQETDLPSAE
jgi:hypothetical protein